MCVLCFHIFIFLHSLFSSHLCVILTSFCLFFWLSLVLSFCYMDVYIHTLIFIITSILSSQFVFVFSCDFVSPFMFFVAVCMAQLFMGFLCTCSCLFTSPSSPHPLCCECVLYGCVSFTRVVMCFIHIATLSLSLVLSLFVVVESVCRSILSPSFVCLSRSFSMFLCVFALAAVLL